MTMRMFKKSKRGEFKELSESMKKFSKNAIYFPEELLIKFNKLEEEFDEFAEKAKKWWEKA